MPLLAPVTVGIGVVALTRRARVEIDETERLLLGSRMVSEPRWVAANAAIAARAADGWNAEGVVLWYLM